LESYLLHTARPRRIISQNKNVSRFKMGKYSTKFSIDWVKTYNWVDECPKNASMAKCTICKCTFKVSNGGISDCRAHSKTQKHRHAEGIKLDTSSQVTLNSMLVEAIGKQNI
ncbi:hypothetical protein Bhyg_12275, partial [Pseudolycoriella hygida]